MPMTSKEKMFAETMYINQTAEQLNDYTFHIVENYLADIRESWESFMLDKIYDLYKEEGCTKVLMISKEDFKCFLMWALPKYQNEVLKENDN